MDIEDYAGIAASAFTSATLIPQLVKIVREKDAEGTSYGMLVVLLIGLSLWIVYGFMKKDPIIVIANSFSLLINVVTVIMRWRYS